ncbi:hypothetical protein [Neorhodopirellula pilleata]|nr:hypothetical protein [Neorhodopirellula pilleata]
MGTYFYPSGGPVAVAYGSVLVAICFEIATVFWSYDFAFWILFQFGTISGLTSRIAQAREEALT